MEKIFNVRGASFQTNSSSDHCVFLAMNLDFKKKINPKDYGFIISKDHKLRIPVDPDDDFSDSSNKPIEDAVQKIKYIVALMFSNWDYIDDWVYENRIQPLKDVLIEYIDGVDDVEFGWDRDLEIDRKRLDRSECFRNFPEVSSSFAGDSPLKAIMESKYTLADFIFNKRSFAYPLYEGSEDFKNKYLYDEKDSIAESLGDSDATIVGHESFKIPVFPINKFNEDTILDTKNHKEFCESTTEFNDHFYKKGPDGNFIKYSINELKTENLLDKENYLFQGFSVENHKLVAIYARPLEFSEATKEYFIQKDYRQHSLKKNKILEFLPKDSDTILEPLNIHINEFNLDI